MFETSPLPMDTGVLIALAAAMGDWEFLSVLGRPMVLTPTVRGELRCGPSSGPGTFTPMPSCMDVWSEEIDVAPWLRGVLDAGEASVIALAMDQGWPEVAIDETVGRSVARTCQLRPVGSLGLLIRAKRQGYPLTLSSAIARIRSAGIWLGTDVERAALRAADELDQQEYPSME